MYRACSANVSGFIIDMRYHFLLHVLILAKLDQSIRGARLLFPLTSLSSHAGHGTKHCVFLDTNAHSRPMRPKHFSFRHLVLPKIARLCSTHSRTASFMTCSGYEFRSVLQCYSSAAFQMPQCFLSLPCRPRSSLLCRM